MSGPVLTSGLLVFLDQRGMVKKGSASRGGRIRTHDERARRKRIEAGRVVLGIRHARRRLGGKGMIPPVVRLRRRHRRRRRGGVELPSHFIDR